MRTADGTHEELPAAALEQAAPAAAAPPDLVVTATLSRRLTLPLTEQADAVGTELKPQVEALVSPEFAGG
jgi:enoyl-CoA hydratase